MRFILVAILALGVPTLAFAGGDDSSPPKPTPACDAGKVYDKKTKTCVDASNHRLEVGTLYQAVRGLAYTGRYSDAQLVLAQMPADDDRTLTYLGFTHRKMGNGDLAMGYYGRALATNPGNILARSYMGQGLVEAGDIAAAIEQLRAIRAHDGVGTWAEASLRTAIATGKTINW